MSERTRKPRRLKAPPAPFRLPRRRARGTRGEVTLSFWKRLFKRKPAAAPAGGGALEAALTDRSRAEAGQRRSEEHLAHLVAGVRDYAIFMLDPQGNILTWNTGAERIKGYRP